MSQPGYDLKSGSASGAGRPLFEQTGLYFSVGAEGGILVEDSVTGERLLTGAEKAEQEAEAREALENEVARLQAELNRLKG